MDYLAPPLNAILHIQLKIKSGLSVRASIKSYIKHFSKCSFSVQMGFWLFCLETGKPFSNTELLNKTHRKILLDILYQGLKGAPILDILQEFEIELKQIALLDLEQQIQKLPFISLIPLFIFQVPAFFLLLLAPLILELQTKFQV